VGLDVIAWSHGQKATSSLLALCVLGSGCVATNQRAPDQYTLLAEQPTRPFISKVADITGDGVIILENGVRVQLLGLRFRPPHEIGDPDALIALRSLMQHFGKVEVCPIGDMGRAIIYYQQPVLYPNRYLFAYNLWMPKCTRGTLNELLIALGLALYQPIEDPGLAAFDNSLRAVASAYAGSVVRGYYRRRIAEFIRHPEHLYVFREGYFANIIAGDYKADARKAWLPYFHALRERPVPPEFLDLNRSEQQVSGETGE